MKTIPGTRSFQEFIRITLNEIVVKFLLGRKEMIYAGWHFQLFTGKSMFL